MIAKRNAQSERNQHQGFQECDSEPSFREWPETAVPLG